MYINLVRLQHYMNNKKIMIIILIILILNLIISIYLTSFNLNAFNKRFYKEEFKKYNVYGEFPDKDIDKINSEILLYLKDKKDDFSKELFSQKEIEHFKDVRLLIQKINIFYYLILIISILLIIILFLLNKRHFLKNFSLILFFSGLLTLFTVIILLILVKLNFDSVFTIFHHIFFPQGGWLFSSSDNIIKLYPSEIFNDMAKNIFISIIFYGNILIGVGILLFKTKND